MPDFPMPRGTCPFDQHPGYAEAAAQGPLTKVSMAHGQIVWFVTGYAETRALFADPRLSVDRTNPGYPGSAAATPEQLANMAETQSFNQLDDPEHAAYRRLAIPSLTVRRTKHLRPALQTAVVKLLDDLLTPAGAPEVAPDGGRKVASGGVPVVDLVSGLAVPLPAVMLALLYGIPEGDRPYFEERVRRAATDRRFGGRALSELSDYLERLLESKDGDGADLLSGLMSGRRGEVVTQRRVLNLAMQTLVAGNESTLSMLAMGILSLLAHRNQWDTLVADPSRVPAAVEELLRYLSVADSVPRVALTDVEIAGEVIRAGDGVLLATPAANRDPRTFPDPDRLDITRPARHHIAFGYGIHQCVGQNLARATLEIAITTLVTRFPDLRLAVPADEILIDGGVGVHRITRLPVTWTTR